MLRIARLTDYAASLMAHVAHSPERLVSAQQLGQELGLPGPTVAKLLKQLTLAGLLQSTRGVGGGYSLARAPERISIAGVIEAIEGPMALTECALANSNCVLESTCATRANWQVINRAVRVALESVTLADMAAPAPRALRFNVQRKE